MRPHQPCLLPACCTGTLPPSARPNTRVARTNCQPHHLVKYGSNTIVLCGDAAREPGATAAAAPSSGQDAYALGAAAAGAWAPAAAAYRPADDLAASSWLLPAGACQIPDALPPAHPGPPGAPGLAGATAGSPPRRAGPPPWSPRSPAAWPGAAQGRGRGAARRGAADDGGALRADPERAAAPVGRRGVASRAGADRGVRGDAAQGRGGAAAGVRAPRAWPGAAPRGGRAPSRGVMEGLSRIAGGLGKTGDASPGHAPTLEPGRCRFGGPNARGRGRLGAVAAKGWAH